MTKEFKTIGEAIPGKSLKASESTLKKFLKIAAVESDKFAGSFMSSIVDIESVFLGLFSKKLRAHGHATARDLRDYGLVGFWKQNLA